MLLLRGCGKQREVDMSRRLQSDLSFLKVKLWRRGAHIDIFVFLLKSFVVMVYNYRSFYASACMSMSVSIKFHSINTFHIALS